MTGPGVTAVPGWADALVWLIIALTAAWAATEAARAACHWRRRHRKLRLRPGDCVRCVSHHPVFKCLCGQPCGQRGCPAARDGQTRPMDLAGLVIHPELEHYHGWRERQLTGQAAYDEAFGAITEELDIPGGQWHAY